ncbi:hypothetical protein N8I74_18940 [Chitiniphilus purpureus]|uniref:Uncharacterized protein n=1 Tax=Chitiniphilus purpureus TaxID=2981137 RepID=A0ABY6DLX6_9NEIS|nr:hypothetical protein [Chitiniphilus sp. CD1]UXY15359.1 hypothetical protein N8I74_18940 [Chitiniphilus sp. CD1]
MVLAFFKEEALARGLQDYGRNNQIYDAWKKHAQDLESGIELAKFGDYAKLDDAAAGIYSTNRGVTQHVWMGWLGDAEEKYHQITIIPGEYAARIRKTLAPGLRGGQYWLHEAFNFPPERRNRDFGPTGEKILLFIQSNVEEVYPHLKKTPIPSRFPRYAPDTSRPIKTGEAVPWTGVWIPAAGLENHSLTFAVEGLSMPPSWRIIKTAEQLEQECVDSGKGKRNKNGLVFDDQGELLTFLDDELEITEMTWYPLLQVDEVERVVQRGRVEANQPCPVRGYWYTPAKQNSRALFEHGARMPDFPESTYGATIWYWDAKQE